MTFSAVPYAQGLYDPANEHDACGVGVIERIIAEEGVKLLGWRDLPIDAKGGRDVDEATMEVARG